MSDSNNKAAQDTVTITVDGQQVQAPKGAMLIEVTDAHNIKVPRFCYHKKLAIAANCRMCLVEVEKAPKPLPACATPVMDGMVVRTQSKLAKDAQKSVMEFLLINHPLDCPICDQGGECELQDVAVGYGQSVSEYSDTKRVVFDKNIGPLIATELTRCIHCTRCVRFGRELAGMRELGMTGRGEHALISAFVGECVNSEMSGNVIDVCPVGALTAKPSRFAARAWEMVQRKAIAPHDCIGSNLNVHTLRGEVVRVVPDENESINEVWLSDRDRFSYQGIDAEDRLSSPMIKQDGQWQQASWDEALQLVADVFRSVVDKSTAEPAAEKRAAEEPASENLAAEKKTTVVESDSDETDSSGAVENEGGTEIAALISASSTLEEQYLTQKLMRALGSGNIDHRLRQSDFSDQNVAPVMPWLGQNIEQLEQLNAALLIGSNIRKEQPIANLRLRKAVINKNAQIACVNPRTYEFNYPLTHNVAVAQQHMVSQLAAITAAAYQLSGNAVPDNLSAVIANATISDVHKTIAQQLSDAESATVLLGNIAQLHPQFSALRSLAAAIAKETGCVFGYLTDGANAAGAWLAGAVPHRAAGGVTEGVICGVNIMELADKKLAACLLLNIEPDTDAANAKALLATLDKADFVVSVSAYNSASLKEVADVLLPAAGFMETSGTYVNVEGLWQSFKGIVKPKGESRPAWKILRVLGNLTGVDDFDYMSSDDVKKEVRAQCETIELSNAIDDDALGDDIVDCAATVVQAPAINVSDTPALYRSSDVPMYAGDAILRRASSLQQTVDAQTICLRLNSAEAERRNLTGATMVTVKQGDNSAVLPLFIDDTIPDASAWIPLAVEGNALLGEAFAAVSVEAVSVEQVSAEATASTAADA